jgi:hypothetical protein
MQDPDPVDSTLLAAQKSRSHRGMKLPPPERDRQPDHDLGDWLMLLMPVFGRACFFNRAGAAFGFVLKTADCASRVLKNKRHPLKIEEVWHYSQVKRAHFRHSGRIAQFDRPFVWLLK